MAMISPRPPPRLAARRNARTAPGSRSETLGAKSSTPPTSPARTRLSRVRLGQVPRMPVMIFAPTARRGLICGGAGRAGGLGAGAVRALDVSLSAFDESLRPAGELPHPVAMTSAKATSARPSSRRNPDPIMPAFCRILVFRRATRR